MTRTAETVLFTLFGITVLLIITFMCLPIVFEARRNSVSEHQAARTREVENHVPVSLPTENFPAGRPIHSDIPLAPQESTRVSTVASLSHNPYDSRYMYTCECPDTWMGDGASCPHS